MFKVQGLNRKIDFFKPCGGDGPTTAILIGGHV